MPSKILLLKVDSFIYMFIFEKSNVVCLEALSLVQVFLHIFTLYCGLYRVGKVTLCSTLYSTNCMFRTPEGKIFYRYISYIEGTQFGV